MQSELRAFTNDFREEIKGRKAAAEISFSKLKLIKTYLRSMMAQERLLDVSTFSSRMRRQGQLIKEDFSILLVV